MNTHNSIKKLIDEKKIDRNDFIGHNNRLLSTDNITLDITRGINNKELDLLLTQLLDELSFREYIKSMYKGEIINISESRRVLHTELRGRYVDDQFISNMIRDNKKKMYGLIDTIRRKKHIKNIIHIGIGGSEKGIRLIYDLFKNESYYKVYFLSNIDFRELEYILSEINIEETICVYCSKSGKTMETFENANYLKDFYDKKLGESFFKNYFFGVGSNKDCFIDFGIKEDNILRFPEEIGGRYSIFSSISLTIALCFGKDFFENFLKGGHKADENFLKNDWINNIPVQMALKTWLYTVFFNLNSICVIPYLSGLKYFIDYYQQLEMESNGKNVDLNGNIISYKTSNVIWGDTGTNAQHSFFQYLCQTNDLILHEFIGIKKVNHSNKYFHEKLMSHFFCQMDLINVGHKDISVYKQIVGRQPVIGILLNELTPESLGELLATYEHRTMAQGFLHNINSFDQWAVEISKKEYLKYYNRDKSIKNNILFKKYCKE